MQLGDVRGDQVITKFVILGRPATRPRFIPEKPLQRLNGIFSAVNIRSPAISKNPRSSGGMAPR